LSERRRGIQMIRILSFVLHVLGIDNLLTQSILVKFYIKLVWELI